MRCSGILILRLGVSTAEISRYAVGLGYKAKRISIDFAISDHRWLGFTSYVTMTYGGAAGNSLR